MFGFMYVVVTVWGSVGIFLLLSSYSLHLNVFVLICQYCVVLLERTNKDIIIVICMFYV